MTRRPPLHHLRLPLTTYAHVSSLQSILFKQHLSSLKSSTNPSPSTSPPPAYIITTQIHPTYTLGRRESTYIPSTTLSSLLSSSSSSSSQSTSPTSSQPLLLKTSRGGRITFHGPGQLLSYPILNLRNHSLSPRCYIRFLETSLITLLHHYSIPATTTSEPGVWLSPTQKIASIGVNLRRYITSHGIGLNISTDLTWFDAIVACGLEGVRMGRMVDEGFEGGFGDVEGRWVDVVAEGLVGCDGVVEITEEEVRRIGRDMGIEDEEGGDEEVVGDLKGEEGKEVREELHKGP